MLCPAAHQRSLDDHRCLRQGRSKERRRRWSSVIFCSVLRRRYLFLYIGGGQNKITQRLRDYRRMDSCVSVSLSLSLSVLWAATKEKETRAAQRTERERDKETETMPTTSWSIRFLTSQSLGLYIILSIGPHVFLFFWRPDG